MASKLYVFYDLAEGRYAGHLYSSQPPMQIEEGMGYRELTAEELIITNSNYENYLYDKPELVRVPIVYFLIGSPPIYEIGIHNKISIAVRPTESLTPEEREYLKDLDIEITVNGTVTHVPFNGQVFLDPTVPGTYEIELTDNRVTSRTPKYTVPVIQPV